MDDISLAFENCKNKNWIKKINFNETILFEDYTKKNNFIHVANVIRDNDIGIKSGKKKRNTVIKFDKTISKEDFDKTAEWLYIFLINKRIVKIGGTRTGLKNRCASYLCGHHTKERNKSGDCSKTNAFIYNTFDFYLDLNFTIEMFAFELPKVETKIQINDKEISITVQTYHVYESIYLEEYKNKYKKYPLLSMNCDPVYKNK